ncbi:MAG: cation:proton antiporter [Trichodesmium sp. St16_bin4-tuft]|uniref:Multisubunit sodium/proton antiporter, MrpE subunit n=1 Tax=Trichodesmium erythraeum (strain IMS101) TaxID=203124 RepID=Q115C9_TRIEI|nr:cation:proton antiporter [Trichodesmium erythraeum GBRTRLIN201]MCH2047688.1 cation:proton antiporter [Trichodesmium sp. ALOHA_ZT_67]MCL2929737.1 cation:proton antiporter [Trichodesmium sp. MAG_R01]MDE5069475.1 cation:proton antiporter [Trichodesmium sp. St4_bin8_1]MDE5072248.1 cation:proton antiporter [Trichodesmium sp. St5_bin8]MDE5078620.1 cation:proton antiporter [Trichodesmium sp. St2_bin6]MDE5095666.1 cation:proton antiporter [Trichodesmium sp. St11_bin5]MDE5097916.1 cation:proton an
MDATALFNIILRLAIWFLLTTDLSWENTIIGVSVACLLPHKKTSLGLLSDWLRVIWEIIVAIPQSYIEAIQMMLHPHDEEVVVWEHLKTQRTPQLIFLDIFLITFTPKTIVFKYNEGGWYEVHRVKPKRKK